MLRIFNKYRENELIKNYTKVFSVDFLVRASNFLLLPVYLKFMTQEEFGLYTYIFAIISTFSLVLNFGLYIPQSKLYQDYEKEEDRGMLVYTLNIVLVLLLIFILSVIYITGLDYLIVKLLFKKQINYESYRFYVLLAIIMTVYSYMITNYFLTSQKIKLVQLYNLSRVFFVNIIVIVFLNLLTYDKVEVRLQFNYVTEFSLLLIFGIFYVRAMKPRFDADVAKRSVKLAFPIMISALLGVVLNFSDKFFLEKYGDFKQLAVYNLGLILGSIIPIIFASFQNIWLPFFFQEKDLRENKEKTKKIIIRMGIIFIILSIAIYGIIYFAISFGIVSVQYSEVLILLPVILITQMIIALTPLLSNYIIYFEKSYIALYTGVPVAILSIIINLYLIPRYGIYGAAISMFITNSAYLVLYYFIIKNLIKKNLEI
ncbi:MAG: lipopolysaccharide biosynthesis protein [Ignavibacteriaceae bacterium]